MNSSQNSILEETSQSVLFQKIGDICTAVNTAISAKELLEFSLKRTMALFGANRGSIYILDATGKKLRLKIAEGMKTSEQKQMVKRMGEGIVGRVAAIKEPVVVDDIRQDSRFREHKSHDGYSTSSFICAPLIVKDDLIGVINITDKVCGSRFTKNELQLLDFLSSQIALNYRRIELYQKFKTIVKESKSLKNKLGKSSKEASKLKDMVVIQEKLASIGKLAGGIAHEFNNPLDGVLRYTNLCLENVKDDEVVRGYLLEIKHGLNRMVNIVRSLLACSRNEKPSMKKIDPNEVVNQALNTVQSEIFHKNIKVNLELKEEMPQLIDFGLERAISNLLRNAIDASDQDGTITVNTDLMDHHVTISIKDSGCGMKAKEIDNIFEPFYTTKDIEKGCGLGLTIVSEIVKNYEGHIKVESAPKKGTLFLVLLPCSLTDE